MNKLVNLVPTSKNAADIIALVEALGELQPGQLLTYEYLTAVIGRSAQRHRYLLEAACNRLLKQNRKAFGAVFGVGIKRLTDTEAIEQCASAMTRVRRIARKAVSKAASVDFAALSDEDKRRHNGYISQMAAIAYTADSRHLNRLTEACQNHDPACLPSAQALKLMAS